RKPGEGTFHRDLRLPSPGLRASGVGARRSPGFRALGAGGAWLFVHGGSTQLLQRLVERLDWDRLDARRGCNVRGGAEDVGEPESRGRAEPLLGLLDVADLAAEADLAERGDALAELAVVVGPGDGDGEGQVGGGL